MHPGPHPHRDIPPIVSTTATVTGAQMIVVLAILFAIMFSGGTIADFLNRISGS